MRETRQLIWKHDLATFLPNPVLLVVVVIYSRNQGKLFCPLPNVGTTEIQMERVYLLLKSLSDSNVMGSNVLYWKIKLSKLTCFKIKKTRLAYFQHKFPTLGTKYNNFSFQRLHDYSINVGLKQRLLRLVNITSTV